MRFFRPAAGNSSIGMQARCLRYGACRLLLMRTRCPRYGLSQLPLMQAGCLRYGCYSFFPSAKSNRDAPLFAACLRRWGLARGRDGGRQDACVTDLYRRRPTCFWCRQDVCVTGCHDRFGGGQDACVAGRSLLAAEPSGSTVSRCPPVVLAGAEIMK